jgi:hypothetical protein
MSSKVLVQYVGFEAQPMVREYTFSVRELGEPREFTLTIANEAFISHRARFQDGPSICALRLYTELQIFAKGHLVGLGTYRLKLVLGAANARPKEYELEVSFQGRWHDDEAEMLRDGFGLRIV